MTLDADRLHRDSLVWDAHSCMPLKPGIDLSALSRHRAAGVDFVSINVGMDMNPWPDVVRVLAHYRAWIADHGDEYVLAGSVAEVLQAKETGKLAIAFDLEGAIPIDGDFALLRLYRDLGVRQMHFIYNRNNAVGGGCHDEDIPLTAFGRSLVEEVNRLGIVVDCSHTGYRTSLDIMAHSTKPVVFSHANPRAFRDHQRNITDEQIRACADTGGVVGINGIGLFLGGTDTETVAACIDYVVQLVGPQHAGIGLDFMFNPEVDDSPPGLDKSYWWPESGGYGGNIGALKTVEPEQLPRLTERLLGLGYGEEDVRNILGGNFLRVAMATWPRDGQ